MFLFPGNSQISMDKKSLKHVRKQYVSLRFLRVSDIGNDFFFVVVVTFVIFSFPFTFDIFVSERKNDRHRIIFD